MHIANPIYDVVFKFLMEDSKIAKLMISSIIGENIEKLTFLPQEFVSDLEKPKTSQKSKRPRKSSLTVYRLDFSAKIKTDEGYKKVIIELQKAKFPTDIMRFRRYLGEQYTNKENVQRIKTGDRVRKVGLPIISIYFLGHKLDHTKSSVIEVSRQYKDLITGDLLTTKESFIESLTHNSYIIQIPYLKDKRRNDLETLLSVFDQSNPVDTHHHILQVEEEHFPAQYRPIIRKLQKAIQDTEIKKKMELEDGIIDELEDMEREIEELEQKVGEIEQEKMKAEEGKIRAEQEKIRAEQKVEEIEQEKIRAEQENEKLKNELEVLRKLLNDRK